MFYIFQLITEKMEAMFGGSTGFGPTCPPLWRNGPDYQVL